MVKKRISTKHNLISKANDMKDYQLCDKAQGEMRDLMREKGRLEIDVTRPWGSPCDSCGNQCTGHYVTDIDKLLELHSNNKAIRALPPGVLIEDAFKQGFADGRNTVNLAKKCCLSVDEVEMWVAHLQKKKATRAKGVEKARETRERKK